MNQHNRKPEAMRRQRDRRRLFPTPQSPLSRSFVPSVPCSPFFAITSRKTHFTAVNTLNPIRFISLQVKSRPRTAPVSQYGTGNQQKTKPLHIVFGSLNFRVQPLCHFTQRADFPCKRLSPGNELKGQAAAKPVPSWLAARIAPLFPTIDAWPLTTIARHSATGPR